MDIYWGTKEKPDLVRQFQLQWSMVEITPEEFVKMVDFLVTRIRRMEKRD